MFALLQLVAGARLCARGSRPYCVQRQAPVEEYAAGVALSELEVDVVRSIRVAGPDRGIGSWNIEGVGDRDAQTHVAEQRNLAELVLAGFDGERFVVDNLGATNAQPVATWRQRFEHRLAGVVGGCRRACARNSNSQHADFDVRRRFTIGIPNDVELQPA